MTGPPLTIGEVLARSAAFIGDRGSGTSRLDAELLLANALGCARIDLYTQHDRPLSAGERDVVREAVARRGRGEPVAYIVGRRAFRNLDLESTREALVPRPETELLVERALARVEPGDRVLDWGTGSGAVALALVDEGPALQLVGSERSPTALALAGRNGDRLGLEVEWVRSDGFEALRGRRFSVIVANPPYLSHGELDSAPRELAYEPIEALVSGPTGLEALGSLAAGAPEHLDPGGWLIAEIGAAQSDDAVALWDRAGFGEIALRADLAGLPRVVEGRR